MYVGRDSRGRFRAEADRRDQKLSVRCRAQDLKDLDGIAQARGSNRSQIALEMIRYSIKMTGEDAEIGRKMADAARVF